MRRLGFLALAALGALVAAAPAPAAYPGANGRIAFQGFQRLDTVNAAGGDRRTLTMASGIVFGPPKWSPDGQRLAFSSNRDGADLDIYLIGAGGGTITPLTANAAEDDSPTWSPDGRRIAFSSDRDGNSEIYVMNADGSGAARLTFDVREDTAPAWSPDGRRIAFRRFTPVGNGDIWTMAADGSGQAPLTTDPAEENNPDWSPDGTRIAFQRGSSIAVMGADGSGLSPLPVAGERPAWAPDGTRIVFDFGLELYASNPNGSGVTQLTMAGATDLIAQGANWQPIPLPPPPPPPGGGGGGGGSPPPPPPAPSPPRLDAPISTLWQWSKRWTRVLRLTVREVPAGAKVEVLCTGRGCPAKRKPVRVRKQRANVQAVFKRRKLRPGAVIEIRITKPGTIGKVVRYTVRPGKQPSSRRLCLPPAATKAARC